MDEITAAYIFTVIIPIFIRAELVKMVIAVTPRLKGCDSKR